MVSIRRVACANNGAPMGVTRILDLIIIALLATVVLLPRPDASVKPALTLDAE